MRAVTLPLLSEHTLVAFIDFYPIDPDLGFVPYRARRQRRSLALLTVFGLLLDPTGGTVYSTDFPFHLERPTRARLGEDFISNFRVGTRCDFNQKDVSTNRLQTAGDESQRIGHATDRPCAR